MIVNCYQVLGIKLKCLQIKINTSVNLSRSDTFKDMTQISEDKKYFKLR